MEIFGVGPLEFLLILVLALVILGPEDMVATARRLGQWVYRLVRSPTWRAILDTTADLRELPQKIVREAGLEEAMNEVKSTADQVKSEMSATTSELNNEMRAATSEVASEMHTAVGTAEAGILEAQAASAPGQAETSPAGEVSGAETQGVTVGIPMMEPGAAPAAPEPAGELRSMPVLPGVETISPVPFAPGQGESGENLPAQPPAAADHAADEIGLALTQGAESGRRPAALEWTPAAEPAASADTPREPAAEDSPPQAEVPPETAPQVLASGVAPFARVQPVPETQGLAPDTRGQAPDNGSTAPAQGDPYAAGLNGIAAALGAASTRPAPPPQTITPEMLAAAPSVSPEPIPEDGQPEPSQPLPSWAQGKYPGLNADEFEAQMKQRMEELDKALEKLKPPDPPGAEPA